MNANANCNFLYFHRLYGIRHALNMIVVHLFKMVGFKLHVSRIKGIHCTQYKLLKIQISAISKVLIFDHGCLCSKIPEGQNPL